MLDPAFILPLATIPLLAINEPPAVIVPVLVLILPEDVIIFALEVLIPPADIEPTTVNDNRLPTEVIPVCDAVDKVPVMPHVQFRVLLIKTGDEIFNVPDESVYKLEYLGVPALLS